MKKPYKPQNVTIKTIQTNGCKNRQIFDNKRHFYSELSLEVSIRLFR